MILERSSFYDSAMPELLSASGLASTTTTTHDVEPLCVESEEDVDVVCWRDLDSGNNQFRQKFRGNSGFSRLFGSVASVQPRKVSVGENSSIGFREKKQQTVVFQFFIAT